MTDPQRKLLLQIFITIAAVLLAVLLFFASDHA
jgi:hypothetical protein